MLKNLQRFSSGTAFLKLVIEVPESGNAYLPSTSKEPRNKTAKPLHVTSVVDETFFDIVQPLLKYSWQKQIQVLRAT